MVYTPGGTIADGIVIIEAGKISATGTGDQVSVPAEAQVIDAAGLAVTPGLIDLHLHGLLGHEVMGAGLAEVIAALPAFGVTAFAAATHSSPEEHTLASLAEMSSVLDNPPPGAACLGIYLEGPFLSPARPGMADAALFLKPRWDRFAAYQDAAGGRIRIAALAPEVEGAMEIIPELVQNGVIAAAAHSDASYEQGAAAAGLGLSLAAHTYNAMRPFHHRQPGILGAVLNLDEIVAEVVGDGVHVHPAAVSLLLRAKGLERVALVSDAAPLAAMPDGEYEWAGRRVVVRGDSCRLADGTLAGSHALLDTGLRNLVDVLGMPLDQALLPATHVPAQVMGAAKGRLEPGCDADIVLLDSECGPVLTLVGGETAFRSS
jgi:N-acetylglucosamine-6-phosphate deacetylase